MFTASERNRFRFEDIFHTHFQTKCPSKSCLNCNYISLHSTFKLCVLQYVDKWYKSADKESFLMSRKLIKEEGLLCGKILQY